MPVLEIDDNEKIDTSGLDLRAFSRTIIGLSSASQRRARYPLLQCLSRHVLGNNVLEAFREILDACIERSLAGHQQIVAHLSSPWWLQSCGTFSTAYLAATLIAKRCSSGLEQKCVTVFATLIALVSLLTVLCWLSA